MIKPANTNKKGIIISFIKTHNRALLLVPINEGPVNSLEPIDIRAKGKVTCDRNWMLVRRGFGIDNYMTEKPRPRKQARVMGDFKKEMINKPSLIGFSL